VSKLGCTDESLLDQSSVLAQVTLESSPDGQRHLIRTLAHIDTAVIRAARANTVSISVALPAGFMHAGERMGRDERTVMQLLQHDVRS
jgi:hypothetical protein